MFLPYVVFQRIYIQKERKDEQRREEEEEY
jgi:hypothetical protein